MAANPNGLLVQYPNLAGSEDPAIREAHDAIQLAYKALKDHVDAIHALKSQLTSTQTSITQVVETTKNQDLSLPLAVTLGGTGSASLSSNSVVLGEGTNAVQFASPSAAMKVLTDNGVGVDPSFQSLQVKAACRLATAAALPTYAYASGVITATTDGALTVDGTTPSVGDRILLKDGAAGSDNGIYDVTQVGDAFNPFILTRSVDCNDESTYLSGSLTLIQEGTANVLTLFLVTTLGTITVGTTSVTWSQVIGGGGSGTVTNIATVSPLSGGPITTSGTLSVDTATTSSLGVVQPDGTSITIAGGVISATAGVGPSFTNNEIVSCSGTSGTLAASPIPGSLALYRNGIRLTPGAGNDYTISGATITLAVAAGVSDSFLADYRT